MTTVRVEGERWLYAAEEEWTELLGDSDADPLFSSWIWVVTWWRTFADAARGSLYILVATDESGTIVGVAPFYRNQKRRMRWCSTRRLTLIGNIWRTDVGVMSEHLDWVCRRGSRDQVAEAFRTILAADTQWDEAVIILADRDATASFALEEIAATHDLYIRLDGEIDSYCVELGGTFEAYLSSLSASTRAKLFNRRRRLERLGDVRISHAAEGDVTAYLAKLFGLYEARWDQSVAALAKKFIAEVCRSKAGDGSLRLSILTVDDQAISAILGLVAGTKEYNIQSAFDDTIDRGLSPGLLHLGYELERAFNSDLTHYDMLAGGGKNTAFKKSLAPVTNVFRSLQIVRNPLLKTAYRIYDSLVQ